MRWSRGLTLSRLIELSLLEKTQVSKLVSALVRQGLLSRQIGELDARQINLFLSTEGESMVKRTYEARQYAGEGIAGHADRGGTQDVQSLHRQADGHARAPCEGRRP
ncbi:hypothetical protein ACU4GD_16465 [Cupriavidus basilensis]